MTAADTVAAGGVNGMLLLTVQFSHHLYPKIFFCYNCHITCTRRQLLFMAQLAAPISNFIFGTTVTKPVPQYSVLCNCYITWTTSISLYPQHIMHNMSVFNFGMVNICVSKLMKHMWSVYGWQKYCSAVTVTIKASGVWNWGKTIRQFVCTSQKHSFSILRMWHL